MRQHRIRSRALRLVAGLFALSLVAAACSGGNGSKASDATATTVDSSQGKEGGELVDFGTFVAAPPAHIDPALNTELVGYQVVTSLYDGLTEVDASDPANPQVKPLVAESATPNADATVWTFKIRDDQQFSNGEKITPTSFSRAWERASNKDFAGDYSYLFNFIKGGKEKLAGTAKTLAGVVADDDAMTLTVTLSAPYSNFDTVAGFQLFSPMPSAVDKLTDQKSWENGLMIGNGPFKLAKPRNDQEIVLVRNDKWSGDIFGNKRAKLDKITFRISKKIESAYASFEAGEGDVGYIPPGRFADAKRDHGTTLGVKILGSYHFEIKWTDPQVGGTKNVKLRQAISQAINRDEINDAVYNGSRRKSTGITPTGIPGAKANLCKYCAYDVGAAKAALADWKAAGNSQKTPIKVLFNQGAGNEEVVQIIIDNLKTIGVDATAVGLPTGTYFGQLAEGACVICRSGWYADYPTYDNFMYDLFHSDAIGGNNHGQYSNPEFDKLVNQAKATVDKDEQAKLFNQAEDILLNKDVAVIPINWYRGQYVYNQNKLANFTQTNLGLVLWEQISLK